MRPRVTSAEGERARKTRIGMKMDFYITRDFARIPSGAHDFRSGQGYEAEVT